MIRLRFPWSPRAALARVKRRLRSRMLRRLERLAERRPRLYIALEAALAAFGLAYLFAFPLMAAGSAVVLGIALVEGGVGQWQALIPWAGATGVGLAMTLFLRRQRPQAMPGVTVSRRDAPELFALVDELRRVYRTPRLHRVHIVPNFTLDTVVTPRLGLPPTYHNTLRIGLPMLQMLPPRLFRVALARSLGQLGASRSTVHGYTTLLRQSFRYYRRLSLESWHVEHLLLRMFFSWFVPLYSLVSFASARRVVLAADREPFKITHDQDIAELLTCAVVAQRFLTERYWPAVTARAGSGQKAVPPFANLGKVYARALQNGGAESWLDAARERRTPAGSAAPALVERLDNLGRLDTPLPRSSDETAASALLGAGLTGLCREFDHQWSEGLKERQRSRRGARGAAIGTELKPGRVAVSG